MGLFDSIARFFSRDKNLQNQVDKKRAKQNKLGKEIQQLEARQVQRAHQRTVMQENEKFLNSVPGKKYKGRNLQQQKSVKEIAPTISKKAQREFENLRVVEERKAKYPETLAQRIREKEIRDYITQQKKPKTKFTAEEMKYIGEELARRAEARGEKREISPEMRNQILKSMGRNTGNQAKLEIIKLKLVEPDTAMEIRGGSQQVADPRKLSFGGKGIFHDEGRIREGILRASEEHQRETKEKNLQRFRKK